MTNIANLLTEHIDIWTAAESEKKSGRGRASGNAGSVYGVKKLRELILELAVRGKLVAQDPNDEPASELLKRIQAEKAQLIAEGKYKKEKLPNTISDEEKAFKIPDNWVYARVNDTGQYINGLAFKPNEWGNVGLPIIRIQNLSGSNQDFNRTEKEVDDSVIVRKGDILVSWSATLDVFVWGLDELGVLNQHIFRVIPEKLIEKRYLFWLLKAAIREMEDSVHAHGLVMTHINRGPFLSHVIGLPPLAEQHRIVAKVDELMALCDQLEQQHSNAQEANETLVSQLLATLTQSQNAAEFNANWQRIYAHFDVLFTTQPSIDGLKQTLLQLAVMGKLVQQDPNDEPASELLKRIQAEKAKLIAEGKLKKEKPLAPISEDEKPFVLPKGWEWSKVLDCSDFVTDGEHATPQRTSDGKIPLVTAKNVRDGYMDYEDTDFVDISVAEKCWKRCKPEQSDLLMVSVGATLGRLTILEEARDMVIVRSVTLIRPCLLSPLYLSLAIKSPLVQEAIWGSVRQMAQPGLYLAQSSNLVIPIAPLAEQHRIVAKVDALMALCDQLRTRIKQSNQQQQTIADALVAQATIQ